MSNNKYAPKMIQRYNTSSWFGLWQRNGKIKITKPQRIQRYGWSSILQKVTQQYVWSPKALVEAQKRGPETSARSQHTCSCSVTLLTTNIWTWRGKNKYHFNSMIKHTQYDVAFMEKKTSKRTTAYSHKYWLVLHTKYFWLRFIQKGTKIIKMWWFQRKWLHLA